MIILHIGLRKAGSTSIQAFLRVNEAPLRAIGIDYPRIGRLKPANHLNIASEIRNLPKFDPAGGTVAELAEYWKASGDEVMILSSEAFEECDIEEARKLDALRRGGDEKVRVVLVIRDLVSLTPSSYTQMVKLGVKTHDFDDFFEKRMGNRRNDYFKTAKRWAKVFGWNSLRVRLLDPEHLLNGDLIDDFMNLAGLDLSAPRASAIKKPDAANVGPGWRVVEAIRALFSERHGLPDDHPLGNALQLPRAQRESLGRQAVEIGNRNGWNADKGRYLTRDQAQLCLEVYGSAIEKLNSRLPQKLPLPRGLDERGFVERDELPDVSQIPAAELRAFYDELGAPPMRGNKKKRAPG